MSQRYRLSDTELPTPGQPTSSHAPATVLPALGRRSMAMPTWIRALVLVLVLVLFGSSVLMQPARAADDGITDYVTIPAGSYIVDMGSSAPTVGNSLKPYGLVYDLVRNQKVPVLWAINPAKAKDGVDFTSADTGKAYRGGPFIIKGDVVTPAVVAVINSWRAQGVIVDGPTTAPTASVPIYDSVSGLASVVLDREKGSIAAAYFTAAGIPATAYRLDTATSLTACDDLFVMPHADPTWATHGSLLSFVQNKAYVWAACHSVSLLENLDNPSTTANPDMNFLSLSGLVPFGSHTAGSPPYTSALPADPVMQFMGFSDAGHLNGSEQIYLPRTVMLSGLPVGGWRPGVRMLVQDPTQANVPSLSPGPAAVMVYGRAFDNPSYGRVMYEGGHNHAGASAANIAAQRAFLNFWLLALLDRSPDVAIDAGGATAVAEGASISLSASVTHSSPVASYQWSSSGGGSFSSPNGATTTFTPPEVASDTPIVIRVTVTDGCSRTAFDALRLVVQNVPKANLSIVKTDSKDPVQVGEAFSYSLAVANAGLEAATSVVVEDVLPTGLGFVSATGTGWACNWESGTRRVSCTRPSLGLTGATPSTIVINVTAPSSVGLVNNTATVSSATPDPVPGNNSSTQSTNVLPGVDVAISNTAPPSVYAGANFIYTLGVSNPSLAAATNLTVVDVLAPELTFVSASGSGWSCSYAAVDRKVSCVTASLAAGASAPISLTVQPSGAVGSSIANTASVSSPDFSDTNLANNSASATVSVAAPADLALSKSGSTTGGVGTQVDTYTVTLTNNGPGTATGIVVNDTMSGPHVNRYASGCAVAPSTGTLSTPSPWSNATITGGTATWNIASMANGTTATLTFTCAGDNNNGVSNVASVTSTSHDPNTANNLASADVIDGTTTVTDLQLSASATPALPATVQTGGSITYRLSVANLGPVDTIGNIVITDTLPAGTTYVSFSSITGSCNCTHASGVVTCTTATTLKKSGATPNPLVVDITVTAPSVAGSITNTASVAYSWGNARYDPQANNTATVSSSVVYPSTDLVVSKAASTTSPALGGNVTFTVGVSNSGANAASNVYLRDLLPAGLGFVSATATQGSYDAATGLWYVGNLAVGASRSLTVVASAGTAGDQVNQACLYAVDQTDTNASNNCASVTVTPQVADLAISKTASTPNPGLGSHVSFLVTLSNNGPSAASAISVQDALPDGLVYVSHSASAGSYNAASGLWSLPGPLANGASASLTVVAKVAVAQLAITNTASITGASVPDLVSSNNSASVVITGRAADIAVTKTVNITAPTALNTPLTFTITAKNNGPSDASAVTVSDQLPAGLLYSSHAVSQGSYDSSSGAWTIGALTNGATATLTLGATNTSLGTLTNVATRTAATPPDPTATNDQASAQVMSGGSADLSLTKSVDKALAPQGGTVVFTLQLENAGPNHATNVRVTDLLPAGLNYQSHNAAFGTYDPLTGLWAVGSLNNGQRATITITALAAGLGLLTNQASVTGLDQADPDATNNSATASVQTLATADLSITKVGPAAAQLGTPITYTIVVRNAGTSNASGVRVSDTVPALLAVSSWTCVASGTADCGSAVGGTGASGTGNNIDLPNVQINAGAANFITLTVTGTASAAGTVLNTATVSPPGDGSVLDPDPSNNSASVSTVFSNSQITGRVFADTGAGGGTPNNGVPDGAEPGLVGVTLRLTDCAGTVHASTRTDSAGNYTLGIPATVPNGSSLCVVEVNPSGYLSTGGQAGSTAGAAGGTYDRAGDRVQFSLATGASYSGVNFGDVPENRLLTDNARTALPGTTQSYPHSFVAGTGGQLSFSLSAASSPSATVWPAVLYRDVGCDGSLNTPTDSPITGPITVAAGETLCVLVQQFVPAGLHVGASNLSTLQAAFSYTNAAPGLNSTLTRQDLTTVSDNALQMLKEVRNVTQAGPWGTNNAARPGEVLEYRISFTNAGLNPIHGLQINDGTPAYTALFNAACPSVVPAGLGACTLVAPVVGATGAVRWQFSGVLQPGLLGVITYQVRVQ